jgi:hypothetical protein
MARFTTAGGEGSGAPGPQGPAGSNGADGADALWNYVGEYSGGASYAVGDVATYDGQLWYRANANGGNVGDTPSEGFIWNLLAAKGVDGADGADGNDGAPGADGAQGDTGSPGLVYLGSYVSGNGYIANLAVVKGSDNNLYIATSSGGLGDPVGNSAEWSIFLPKGVDGEDAVLPQDLGTTDSPTFSKITLTSNGAIDNITIGDDVLLGDGNIANHLVIVGNQDPTQGGIVLGNNKTEQVSSDGSNLSLDANNDIILNPGSTYAYIGTPTIGGETRIATWDYVATSVGTGSNGEVTRWTPNFTATGLTFTGSGATHPTYNSHYVKNGRMVSFWIAIDLATVTNFGTGQYITALPYAPLTGTMNHFQAWANVDPTVNPDIAGHVVLQADHLANTTALDLHYLKQAGGANSPLMEAMFTQGAPATLTTSSKIYINGTYITAE